MQPRLRGSVFGANIGNALEALRANRLRSFLTLLGIIIGIASFIAVVIIALGANMQLSASQLRFARIISVEQQRGRNNFIFTQSDLDALQRLPYVASLDPSNDMEVNVSYLDKHLDTPTALVGASANYPTLFPTPLSEGLWWNSVDDMAHKPVIVLGSEVAQALFQAGTNPVGELIRVNTNIYRVIGVLQGTGDSGFDNTIFAPYTTVSSDILGISIQVDDVSHLASVQANVRTTLEQEHHIVPGQPDRFDVTKSTTSLQNAQQTDSVLEALFLSISAISLIIGGIGIMNIMLVSVTERTREIGLRAALGAEPADIRNQFLIESLTLCFVGSAIGLLFGLVAGYELVSWLGFPFVLSPLSFLVAFSMATVVGVGFGLYPAIRAARLDPIVALRTD